MTRLALPNPVIRCFRCLYGIVIVILLTSLFGGAAASANIVMAAANNQPFPYDTTPVQYPAYLNNAPQDSLIDKWGGSNRECVSYTAWKVATTFHDMPDWNYWEKSDGTVLGTRLNNGMYVPVHANALNWPTLAQDDNIPTGVTPTANSVAVLQPGSELYDVTDGEYGTTDASGHVMWVEQVLTDGDLIVSQYNMGGNGQFSRIEVNPYGANLTYIYFGEAANAK